MSDEPRAEVLAGRCPYCRVPASSSAGPYRAAAGAMDRRPLLPAKHQAGVVFLTCEGCGGAFFERSALAALESSLRSRGGRHPLDQRGATMVDRAFARGRARQHRSGGDLPAQEVRCPACDGETIEREWSIVTYVWVDVCIACRGVWLDGGELTQLERSWG